jgi:hypothetical protein
MITWHGLNLCFTYFPFFGSVVLLPFWQYSIYYDSDEKKIPNLSDYAVI